MPSSSLDWAACCHHVRYVHHPHRHHHVTAVYVLVAVLLALRAALRSAGPFWAACMRRGVASLGYGTLCSCQRLLSCMGHSPAFTWLLLGWSHGLELVASACVSVRDAPCLFSGRAANGLSPLGQVVLGSGGVCTPVYTCAPFSRTPCRGRSGPCRLPAVRAAAAHGLGLAGCRSSHRPLPSVHFVVTSPTYRFTPFVLVSFILGR